jgi:hypothetical protein
MKRQDIARIIAQAEQAGISYYTGLLRDVQRAELNMIVPMRDTVMPPLYRLGKQGRPLIVLLGDDDYRSAGPQTWACAAKLRDWAAFAIIHGTGAERWHYDMASAAARNVRRLLLIETTSAAAQDWAAFLHERSPKLPFLGILPPDGAHPVMPSKGQVH